MHFSNLAEGISIFTVGHIIIFSLEQANLKPTIANYYLVIETQKKISFQDITLKFALGKDLLPSSGGS